MWYKRIQQQIYTTVTRLKYAETYMFKEWICILEHIMQFLQLHQVALKSLDSVVHLLQVGFHRLKHCLSHCRIDKWSMNSH